MRVASRWFACSLIACAFVACRPRAEWTVLSPDSGAAVRVTRKGALTCVIVRARVDGCFDGVAANTLTFEGGHVAYAARIGELWTIVRDGTPGTMRWSGVGPPRLSADGARVAYPVLDGRQWRVVADEIPGPRFDAIRSGTLIFDRSGRRLAYVAMDSGGSFVVVDGVRAESWAWVGAPVFGDDGEHVAYVARVAGRETIIRDGQRERSHDQIVSLALGTGARWAYVARDGDSASVFVDAALASRSAWRGVGDVALGSGDLAAYLVADGVRTVVMASRQRFTFDLVVAGTLQFVDDGTRWACLAGDRAHRELFLVVDGERVGGRISFAELANIAALSDGDAAVRRWVAELSGRRRLRGHSPTRSVDADDRSLILASGPPSSMWR